MKSKLYKWNEKWQSNPSNGIAQGGELVYAVGDETLEAVTGEDACRIIVFFDPENEKAALLHLNDLFGTGCMDQTKAIRSKKFSIKTTQVYLCGDQGSTESKEWNDDIENHLTTLGFNVVRISKGKEKNVRVNAGSGELEITDGTGFNLLPKN